VLAGLVAGAHNVLVLDEPTNHLDIPSAERLEQALSAAEGGFDGTLLLITHDRMLLQDTCDKLIVFDQPGTGQVRVFPGSYSEWDRKQRETAIRAAAPPRPSAKPQAAQSQKTSTKSPGSKPTGLAALSMSKLESSIEELQTRIAQIDRQMLEQSVFADGPKSKALQVERAHCERELEPLEKEWARRAEEA
jgi:ATP-binding cassette subfamily F protein 3